MAELTGIIKVNGDKSKEIPCSYHVTSQGEIEALRQTFFVDGYDIFFRIKKPQGCRLMP